MIQVYLDNEQLEVAEDVSIGLTVSVAQIEDPISASASFTQSIDVPRTTHNEVVFGHTEQILSPDIFNHSEHTAAVYEDGVELIKGKAYFEGATDTHYKLQIVGNEFDWLERIKEKKLNEIDSDTISQFREYETMTEEQRKEVFFGLLDHGCWWQEVDDEVKRREWATPADLVPFVGLTTILRNIFKGYTIDTGSVTELLSRLYVTGAWKRPDNADTLADDNAFELSCNGRNVREVEFNGEMHEVVGGVLGNNSVEWVEVFDTIESSKGNIVMKTYEESVGGQDIPHYSPYFEPTKDLRIAYKLHLKYTSTMANRGSLGYAFVDTVYFGDEETPIARFSLNDGVHWLADAEALNAGLFREAKITPKPAEVIPSESEKSDFYLELSDPSMYTEVVQICWRGFGYTEKEVEYITIAEITSERTHFRAACYFDNGIDNTPKAAIGLRTKYGDIVVIGDAEQAWEKLDFTPNSIVLKTPCTNENEVREVAVRLFQNSDVSSITFDVNILTTGFDVPSGGTSLPVGFSCSGGTGGNEVLFSVAEATIEPVFNFAPKWLEDISLNDVGGDIEATEALKAIMQLLNLRIYTNSDNKTVYILPYSEFYSNDVVDWSDRVDRDKGVEITTIGDNIGKAFKLSYAEENSVVAEYNKRHKEPYLSWNTPLQNKVPKAEYELQNSAFNPPFSISARRVFPNSESEYNILQVADASTQDDQSNVDLANIPRTLVMLQSGEDDDLMYFGNRGLIPYYVQPIFTILNHSTGDCISFGDVDGEQGFHYYYDKQVQAWNYGKRITCYCRVEPQEIESLRKADTSVVDFRSKFKLNIDGEDIYCRLESIENYEPQNATHKCTFIFFN
jgi:hypothetical protein